MHFPQTWRNLLGNIIEDPHERQRIATALGMHTMTLNRWVNEDVSPRTQNLRRLLEVLPQHREVLLPLMQEEFPDIASELAQNASSHGVPPGIPAGFYTRVLHTKAYTSKQFRFSSLCELILQQILKQLDPHRVGVAAIIARCMPPSSQEQVRSLRESQGEGTPPWPNNLESQGVFLGGESLAGSSIISGHLQANQRLSQTGTLAPGYQGKWEESAVATPIFDAGRMAGALLVSSVLPDYFIPTRCALVEQYAELIALAFAEEDFYEPERIQLGVMPHERMQQLYLSRFRQRVNELMKEAARRQQSLTIIQAEQAIWQQLEAELLELHTW